jgi:hypothetical protein
VEVKVVLMELIVEPLQFHTVRLADQVAVLVVVKVMLQVIHLVVQEILLLLVRLKVMLEGLENLNQIQLVPLLLVEAVEVQVLLEYQEQVQLVLLPMEVVEYQVL